MKRPTTDRVVRYHATVKAENGVSIPVTYDISSIPEQEGLVAFDRTKLIMAMSISIDGVLQWFPVSRLSKYVYNSFEASTTHIITHNLTTNDVVLYVEDDQGNPLSGFLVTNKTVDSITLMFGAPIKIKAVLLTDSFGAKITDNSTILSGILAGDVELRGINILPRNPGTSVIGTDAEPFKSITLENGIFRSVKKDVLGNVIESVELTHENINQLLQFSTQIFATEEQVEEVATKIGDLSLLNTDDKTDVVSAINEVKSKASEISDAYLLTRGHLFS